MKTHPPSLHLLTAIPVTPSFLEAVLFSCSSSQHFGLLLFTEDLHGLPAFWSLVTLASWCQHPLPSGRSLSLLPSTQTSVAPLRELLLS